MPILQPSFIRTLFLFLAFLLSGLASGGDQEAGEKKPSATRAVKDEPVEVMEKLAEFGIEQAVQAIANSGGFYPFAFLQSQDGESNLMGYEGPGDKAPPADQFARQLFQQARMLIDNNPQLEAAAVYRMHIADQDGKKVPGVWCLVDHRDAPALIVFQPLVPKSDGSGERVLGEIVYQKSEDTLFPVEDKKPAPPAD